MQAAATRWAERRGAPRAAWLAAILLAALLAWGCGLAWFIADTARVAPPPPHADGIVALTGGADRVETALRLLAGRRADRLLISGTGGGADLAGLAARAGIDAGPLAGRVTLGRAATTTRGNAEETARWVRANDIRSLIVVTAFYHMPRAMLELARALPEVALHPVAVAPQAFADLHQLAALRLLAEEYTKFLGARLGITALLPDREAVPTKRRAAG